jgi:hypothetical protein
VSDKKARITRLVVGLGRTSRPDLNREEWQRAYYELEFQFSEGTTSKDFELSRKSALEAIKLWLSEKPAEEPKPSAVSIEEIDKLPWRSYQTKDLIGPGHHAWILWERDGGEELAKAIREAPEQKLKIGPYEFAFSGKEKQFLSRKVVEPIPEETVKP